MTPEQEELVLQLLSRRITPEEFVARSGMDPLNQRGFARSALQEALVSQDGNALEFSLYVCYYFELLTPDLAPLLAEILLHPWHYQHEDLARTLQQLRDPSTADALAEAASMKHEYLAYDDSHAFARKCMWALADIGSPKARRHLERLAQAADPVVAGYAQKRLDQWEQELGRKGTGPFE